MNRFPLVSQKTSWAYFNLPTSPALQIDLWLFLNLTWRI